MYHRFWEQLLNPCSQTFPTRQKWMRRMIKILFLISPSSQTKTMVQLNKTAWMPRLLAQVNPLTKSSGRVSWIVQLQNPWKKKAPMHLVMGMFLQLVKASLTNQLTLVCALTTLGWCYSSAVSYKQSRSSVRHHLCTLVSPQEVWCPKTAVNMAHPSACYQWGCQTYPCLQTSARTYRER